MLRVIGIDPGTVTIDACGLEDGRMFLDRSVPTAEALADPARFVGLLEAAGPVDCIAGPSGYGLPLTRVQEATEEDLRLAFLAAEGEPGGIGGLRALARALARSTLPVFFTPGVIHLPSVPAHRKVNRVDMGTAEKVCAAALAIDEQARRTGRSVREVSFVLLELGGAFTAALAVADGQIVDGVGGSAGPLGFRGPGALDGEVAFLAGSVPKSLLFDGGAAAVAGWDGGPGSPDALGNPRTARERIAREAFVEGAVKTVRFLRASVPAPRPRVMATRVLIAGVSTRGFAESAARAGYHVVAVDGFGDLDLRAWAATVLVARPKGGTRFSVGAALRAARGVSRDVVTYVASFENHPAAVGALARRGTLWGNPPAVLRRVRDPVRLARALSAHGLPAPAVRLSAPRGPSRGRWLLKSRASGGGSGIVPWRGRAVPAGSYLQQRIAGAPGSIVFAADGRRAVPLGVSRLLAGDRAFGASGFRYCGNILSDADHRVRDIAGRIATAVTREFGLVGVNGIDFVARGGVPYPLEVNPRYTASLELVERAHGLS